MNGRWATRVAVPVLTGALACLGDLIPAAAIAAGPIATVHTEGTPLNVRAGASTATMRVAQLGNGTVIAVACQVTGQAISGPGRSTTLWIRLVAGGYVSDAYVRWSPRRPVVPSCSQAARGATATVRTGGGRLNVRTGASTRQRLAGRLSDGTALTVQCQVYGQLVRGAVTVTAMWDRLAGGRYVSDAYVQWRPARPHSLPWCGQLPPDARQETPAQFIARVGGPAQQSMRLYKVPASVTIAQAILESGWGRSGLAAVDHNYFGIKCFAGPGVIAVGCRTYPTTECVGNRCYRTTAQFRVYRGTADSFADHGRFLVVNQRYRKAFQFVKDPNRFAIEIHKAGYATSPTYSQRLIALMKQYNLYRFDKLA
jgi:flagellar protein FlgJ